MASWFGCTTVVSQVSARGHLNIIHNFGPYDMGTYLGVGTCPGHYGIL